MARGMQLTFDLIVIAAVVGFVLAIVLLIFLDHAQSFNESIDRNRCIGIDCGLDLNQPMSGVHVSHPSTVYVGERAIYRVVDEHHRFSSVMFIPDDPERLSASALAPITGRILDPGPSVHTTSYEETGVAGEYPYRLVGITRDGEEVLIERGVLRVIERDGIERVSARIGAPERMPSPGFLTVRIEAPGFDSGRLIFASADDVVRIDLAYAGDGVLAGRSLEGLEPGIYLLDPDASRLGESMLDGSLNVMVRVTDPIACTSSSSCDDEMPFCTSQVCSPVCAASGERAEDRAGCCADLVLDDEGVCRLPGRALRIVLVPFGVDDARMTQLASGFESALRSSSPLDACSSSRLSVEVSAPCGSCAMAHRDVSHAEYVSCLDSMISCGIATRPDVDIVGGIVGSDSLRIGGDSFFARAERGGQRFIMADPLENAPGNLLRQVGHLFGLGQLACGVTENACTGPNAADCGECDPDDLGSCDEEFSREFVMASCDRLTFGPAAYELLAHTQAFALATEVCG